MNAFHFLSSPISDALGWTLLHALWQGFLLVIPVAIGLHLLRHRSSALRYRLGVLTLTAQLPASMATFIWYYKPASTTLPAPVTGFATQAVAIRWQTVTQTLPWHQQMQLFLENHLSQFVLIYLIGVALFGLRLAGGWIYLQRLSQTATKPTSLIWANLTDQLRSALALRAIVQVRESARIAVPLVVGVLKPVLLLPIGLATHLTTREIEVVLAHELAHIKRHDYAVNLLQSVVEVLYFFHPALWWLSARVREEREHCCDDLAVQACGGDGRILAQALARVEELRLMQSEQAPKLAMAFASKRQHLLHRVRRMLGVPTQPFVSNSSLAGLTLATILLMSVSVYAVQKQDKPKSRTTQPHPPHSTRHHKIDSDSEYGMVDNKKISYVIWKGQKLPTARVVTLQRQLNQVMAGKLSLDDVPESNRDILLTIIEKNQAFDGGMESLTEGLSHIDYDNIVASALKNIPFSPDGTVEGLAKVNYDSIIRDAMAAIPYIQNGPDTLAPQRAYQQRQIDSLEQLLSKRSKQVQAIHLQMEQLRFPIEELQRSQEVLNWRKDKLMAQRNALIEKHQRLLYNDGKQKLSTDEVEKQLATLQPEIKKLEGSMEELNKQMEGLNAKQEDVKLPMDKLQREADQLEDQMNNLSDEMSQHGDRLSRLSVDLSNMDVNVNMGGNHIIRTPRAPRPPRPMIAPNVNVMAPAAPAPAPALRGHIATPAAPSAPSRMAAPRSMPRPALAPKAEQPERPEKPERKEKREKEEQPE